MKKADDFESSKGPIPIRAHHIPSLFLKMDFAKYKEALESQGYALDRNYSFINYTWVLMQSLINSPETLIKILVGEPDYICNVCPKKDNSCEIVNPKHPTMWFSEEDYKMEKDLGIADSCELEGGKIYSIRELMENPFVIEQANLLEEMLLN